MNATTKTARVTRVGGSYTRGIVILTLSDGATLRARSDETGCTPDSDVDIGTRIAYDVDGAGNRYNPRLASADDGVANA